ncbi:cyclic nucleotide-binding domain-containing protein [Streptomyces misionensis]|uniref:hypothetical protein n=1 Tax=Streptomyces misionensis TaxID=67331 RepID=UPI0033A1E792
MSTAEHRHGAIRETRDRCGAFPRLTPEQLQDLTGHGERRRTTEGEVLYREREPFQEFLAILSGTVPLHGLGKFPGEFGLLGKVAFDTAVVREVGKIVAVPVEWQRALAAASCPRRRDPLRSPGPQVSAHRSR